MSISELSRKICALDMEALGVAEACATVLARPTPYLVIKGVTDHADFAKDDKYHEIACEAIADLVTILIEHGVIP